MKTQLVAHGHGAWDGANFTADNEVFCTFTRVAQGQYRITYANQLIAWQDLKVSIFCLDANGAACFANLAPAIGAPRVDALIFDDAGAAFDPSLIGMTVEQVMRI